MNRTKPMILHFTKKRIVIAVWVVFLLLLAISILCCTMPIRDPSYSNTIRAFLKMAHSGASIDLFDGNDLSGWVVHGLGKWSVRDGVLSVQRGIGYLSTDFDQFQDLILTLQVRVSDRGNSGVFFRADHPGLGIRPWPRGFEAQVDHHDPKNLTGSLYNRVSARRTFAADNEWFEMKISAIGPRIRIWVNGESVVDVTDPSFKTGFIALQAHDPFCRVDFKNIRLQIP